MFTPTTGADSTWVDIYKPWDTDLDKTNMESFEKGKLLAAAQQAAKQKAADERHAKELEIISKEPPHTRKADDDLFADATIEHRQSVLDNIEGLYDPDHLTSTKSNLNMRRANEKIVTMANKSAEVNKIERAAVSQVKAWQEKGLEVMGLEEFNKQMERPYTEFDIKKLPKPVINTDTQWDEGVYKNMEKAGILTAEEKVNPSTGQIERKFTTTPSAEQLNEANIANYVRTEPVRDAVGYKYGKMKDAKLPLRPALISENGIVAGKVPTYEDYMQKDENGVVGFNAPQFYSDQIAKRIPVTERMQVVNPPSVASSGGATFDKTIPIVAQGGKESPILTYPLMPDRSAVKTDIKGKTYDITSVEDVRLDENNNPISGYGIVAKPSSKLIEAQHLWHKRYSSAEQLKAKSLAYADAGLDEKGKALEGISKEDQKSKINQVATAQFKDLKSYIPKASDYPTDVQKIPMTGAEIEKASKGVNLRELVTNGKTKGARIVDYTTKKKSDAPAQDKFIQKKVINGVERSVYQRADGTKYAK